MHDGEKNLSKKNILTCRLDGATEKKERLYLYKIDKEGWSASLLNGIKRIDLKDPSIKKSGFFKESVWTTESARISGFNFDISGFKYMKIRVYGDNIAYHYDPDKMGLELFVDGTKVNYHSRRGNSIYFEIDQNSAHEITIHTKTFVPKKYGMGNDSREVGIDIASISFIKKIKKL